MSEMTQKATGDEGIIGWGPGVPSRPTVVHSAIDSVEMAGLPVASEPEPFCHHDATIAMLRRTPGAALVSQCICGVWVEKRDGETFVRAEQPSSIPVARLYRRGGRVSPLAGLYDTEPPGPALPEPPSLAGCPVCEHVGFDCGAH